MKKKKDHRKGKTCDEVKFSREEEKKREQSWETSRGKGLLLCRSGFAPFLWSSSYPQVESEVELPRHAAFRVLALLVLEGHPQLNHFQQVHVTPQRLVRVIVGVPEGRMGWDGIRRGRVGLETQVRDEESRE